MTVEKVESSPEGEDSTDKGDYQKVYVTPVLTLLRW